MAEDIDVGFILKKAFKSLIHDPGYIILFLVPSVVTLVFGVISWLVMGIDFQTLVQASANPQLLTTIFQDKIPLLIVIGIVSFIVTIVASVTVIAAAIKKVEAQEAGKKLNVPQSLSVGFSYFPRLFGATLLFIIIVVLPILGMVGLIMLGAVSYNASLICLSTALLIILLIPLIYFIIRLCLFSQTCVVEKLGAVDSLKRSWNITKGKVILLFVTFLIIGIIAFAVMIPFTAINAVSSYNAYSSNMFNATSMPTTTQSYSPIGTIANFIGQLLMQLIIAPLSLITLTLFYLGITKKHNPLEPHKILSSSSNTQL
ncbi:MAG: hypothetical protein JW771_06740 [Candidatus Thermoplasmatota archaeon]|nr:hypothetical protein [Candidatus Thermoplasmatota archaeon]